MKTRTSWLGALLIVLTSAAVAHADPQKCEVCSMKIDDAHNIHYRYVHEKQKVTHVGSVRCATKYWSAHKDQKMTFEAKDFVSGKFEKADSGVFLLGSALKVGTGMDRPNAVFFAKKEAAERAKKANGGEIVSLDEAVRTVSQKD